jgi:hypothetical protein
MMLKRKFLLLALALLLLSVGFAVAQPAAQFVMQRSVLLSGGSADSASYKVTSVIGQPATGAVTSANFGGYTGFLFPLEPAPASAVWLPLIVK